MKKIIAVILLFSSAVFAQRENAGQSIELPDFVITGTQSVVIPEMEKKKPPVLSIMSDDFFRPVFSSEQINLNTSSNPVRREVDLFESAVSNAGLLILGAGLFTLPTGDFYFNQGFNNALIRSHVWGSKIIDYEEYSGDNESGISGSADFFLSSKSNFLPGMKISVNGNYSRDSYYFFASDTPWLKRETELTTAGFELSSRHDNSLKYGIIGKGDFFNIKNNIFKENKYNGKAFLNMYFSKFGVGADINILNQKLFKSTGSSSYTFYDTDAYFLFDASNSFLIKFGINYSKLDTISKISPQVNAAVKLEKNLSFFGEYKPYSEFMTAQDLLRENRYLSENGAENILIRNKNVSKFIIKYEHERFLGIDLGISFSTIDNLPFFSDDISRGKFEINLADDVKDFKAFLKLDFHGGPLGDFYGNVSYNYLKDSDGMEIPYNSPFHISALYGFDLSSGINLSARLNYFSSSYSDYKNEKNIPSYIDLSFYLKYNLFGGLIITGAIENILNKDNFIYKGYKEKPFDIIGGIEYRW